MKLGHRRVTTGAVAAMLAIGLTACEPPPPRVALTVDSIAAGSDDDPGDGVCSAAAAGGSCTLRAAIEEGNAASAGADLTVPAGHYRNVDATITGDLVVNAGTPANVKLTDSTLTVAAGARIHLSGINTSTSILAPPPSLPDNPASSVSLLQLEVAGSAVVVESILGDLDIGAGAGVVLRDSVVASAELVNDGRLFALRSTMLGNPANGPAATVLTTGTEGGSTLMASVLAVDHATVLGSEFPGGGGTCAGLAPTSMTHMFVEVPCGPMIEPGDGSGDAGATRTVTMTFTGVGYREVGAVHELRATSPLVDAVPIGDPACPADAVDVYGNPRGVDGNGDGIGGCDIGAVERQPAG